MIKLMCMREPLVSVIMPAYNAERFIGEAILSILNQTYKNFELIIIEDSSIDNTLAEIEKWKDQRIRLFCNEKNRGISYSTNRGIALSKGEYIALLDDDDIAEPERLSIQVEYMRKNTDIDIVGGRYMEIDEEGNIIQYCNEPRNNPKYIKVMLLFHFMDFANGSVMIRKEFIEKNHLSFQENCYGMQDFRFYIESSKIGSISSVNQFVMRHRIHENNESKRRRRENSKERAETLAAFQKYSLERSGFLLDIEELNLFTKVFAEAGGCDSMEEWNLIFQLFMKMVEQAKKMNVDYYDELKHFLRVKLSEKLCTFEVFK